MVAYNFQSRFAPEVETGRKRQTFRAIGKRRHARPGEVLQLYTGMRTKGCRKLMKTDPECQEVVHVRLYLKGRRAKPTLAVMQEGVFMDMPRGHIQSFALADGFESVAGLFDFFETTHGLPFEGVVVKW
jgi:hypothetical protein